MSMIESLYYYFLQLPIEQLGAVGTLALWFGVGFAVLSMVFGPRRVLKPAFGEFEPGELSKFALLGLIFGIIIGVYWTFGPLKMALFQDIVGGEWQPWAKWVSLGVIFPLVVIYSKLVEKLSRDKLFYVVALVYGTGTFILAYYFFDPEIGLDNLKADPSRIIGWVWYVFVESFASMFVALFWAFATDITTADSAKKGFFFITMFGQLGGVFIPQLLTKIPKIYDISNAYTVLICGFVILAIIPLVWFFMRSVPEEQLQGFGEQEESGKAKPKAGFLEGLKLLVSQPYLLGIFGIVAFFEIIGTVFDYYFQLMGQAQILDKAEKLAFFGEYASYTNMGTFLCLALGIGNIQRRLSLTTALTLMPFLVGISVWVFRFYPSLQPLFWVMVLSKAVNYSLNGPTLKQLYIPTSRDVRYKTQAWIESFGSRGSKATGSILNAQHKRMLLSNGPEWADPEFARTHMFGPLDLGSYWYMAMSSYFFVGILALWVIVALYLGRTYQRAIETNEAIC